MASETYEPEIFRLCFESWGARHAVWDAAARQFIWGTGSGPRIKWEEIPALSKFEPMDRDGRQGSRRPSPEEWCQFWQIMDKIGIWDWPRKNGGDDICDGSPWYLSIKYGNRRLSSKGNLSECIPVFWELFERSVDAIAGRPKIILPGRPDPPNNGVERIVDLLRLVDPTQFGPFLDSWVSEEESCNDAEWRSLDEQIGKVPQGKHGGDKSAPRQPAGLFRRLLSLILPPGRTR